MSNFTNLKAREGFTIVELLIVVVVIAILAAITIVSYNGITNKANSSAAKSAAASVQKKAELYASDESKSGYPKVVGDMAVAADSSKPYYLTGVVGTTNAATAPTSSNGKTTVQYVACGTGSANTAPTTQATITTVTGALVHWYDFENSRVTTTSTSPASISIGQVSGTVGAKNIGCPTAA